MPQKMKGARPADKGPKETKFARDREWRELLAEQMQKNAEANKAKFRSDLHENLPELTEGSLWRLGNLCDILLNELNLGYELDHNMEIFPEGRASLCQFLDIGASTLSVWLKSGSIPRAARMAVVLLYLREELRGELRELRDDIGDIVVKNGDSYQLARLRESKDGTREWEVVVDGVKTAAAVRELKSALNLQKAASQHSETLESAEHYLGNLAGGGVSEREPFEKMADAIWAVLSQLKGEAQ